MSRRSLVPRRMRRRARPELAGGAEAWELARSTARKCSDDRIFGMASEAGFWQLISFPSLLLAVFGAVGYLGGLLGPSAVTHIRSDVLRAAADVLSPSAVNGDVAPIVDEILKRGHAGVLSVSFVISLWSGSSAMAAYVNTITVAYGMRGIRGALRSRLVALGLYLGAVLAGAVLLPAAILGPDAIVDLAPTSVHHDVSGLVHDGYWPALVVISVVAVTTMYRLSLPRPVRWAVQLPGAVLAVAIWLGGSVALRTYLTDKVRADTFYGALAAPLAALLFFYVTALAVLLGAEVNAARHLRRPPAPPEPPAPPAGPDGMDQSST